MIAGGDLRLPNVIIQRKIRGGILVLVGPDIRTALITRSEMHIDRAGTSAQEQARSFHD